MANVHTPDGAGVSSRPSNRHRWSPDQARLWAAAVDGGPDGPGSSARAPRRRRHQGRLAREEPTMSFTDSLFKAIRAAFPRGRGELELDPFFGWGDLWWVNISYQPTTEVGSVKVLVRAQTPGCCLSASPERAAQIDYETGRPSLNPDLRLFPTVMAEMSRSASEARPEYRATIIVCWEGSADCRLKMTVSSADESRRFLQQTKRLHLRPERLAARYTQTGSLAPGWRRPTPKPPLATGLHESS